MQFAWEFLPSKAHFKRTKDDLSDCVSRTEFVFATLRASVGLIIMIGNLGEGLVQF